MIDSIVGTRGFSQSTVKQTLFTISAVFELLADDHNISINPFKAKDSFRKMDVRNYSAIDPDDVKRLLNTPTLPHVEALFALLLGAGLRIQEAFKARATDFEYHQDRPSTLLLRDTKTKDMRLISLSPWVAEKVRKAIGESKTIVGFSSSRTLYDAFYRHLRLSGVTRKYTPHCCRVTAITTLLDNGVSHRDVMRFSGHSSIKMVERYDRMTADINKNPGLNLQY